VNNSEPAKMTRVSAIPKEAPITVFVAADPLACKGAPMAKMRTMPRPTYAPASAESTRYWRGPWRRRNALARAAPAMTPTVSCSTGAPSRKPGSGSSGIQPDEDAPSLHADLVGGDAYL